MIISMTEARARLAELANRAAYGGERVVLTRHSKPFVALIPAVDLARLDARSPEEVPSVREHRLQIEAVPEVYPLEQAAATYLPPPGEQGRPSW